MKAFKATTMTDLHTKICDWYINAKREEIDVVTNSDAAQVHTIAMADSMAFDWDVKDLWLTRMRWNALVKQYLNPEQVEAFIGQATERVGKKGRGIAVLRSNVILPRGGNGFSVPTRKWGSCILTVSYTAKPVPTITMHSRTSYLGYLGALDMNVAWNLGRYIAREMDMKVEDLKFVWFNEATQWHFFKSMAYMLNHPDPEQREFFRWITVAPDDEIDAETQKEWLDRHSGAPIVAGARRWLTKILSEDDKGTTYGEMNYNTYRRVRRRYHREILGYDYAKQFEGYHYPRSTGENLPKIQTPTFYKVYPELPSISTTTLDLSPIKMPLSRRYGQPFVEEADNPDIDNDELDGEEDDDE